MAKDKDSWLMFFPNDWQSDNNLRLCSIAARGLWIELLCIMHQSDTYGHLSLDGQPLSDEDLSEMIAKITLKEVIGLRVELLQRRVPGVTDQGVWFSRRLLRDKEMRDGKSSAGKKGAEAEKKSLAGAKRKSLAGVKKSGLAAFGTDTDIGNGSDNSFEEQEDRGFRGKKQTNTETLQREFACAIYRLWHEYKNKITGSQKSAFVPSTLQKIVNYLKDDKRCLSNAHGHPVPYLEGRSAILKLAVKRFFEDKKNERPGEMNYKIANVFGRAGHIIPYLEEGYVASKKAGAQREVTPEIERDANYYANELDEL